MKLWQCPPVQQAKQKFASRQQAYLANGNPQTLALLQSAEEELLNALKYPITASPIPRSHQELRSC